jgi:uncharacterized protein YbcC (UPF0753/DUF2309 family)
MEDNELMPIEQIRQQNLFAKQQQVEKVEEKAQDGKDLLVQEMFEQAVVHEVSNNEELKNKVLDTAKKFTDTKMKVIEQNVDAEHKEANFNNKKDACESYGFNEKMTPIWATKLMSIGYSVMLAIWLLIGTFTYMPVIFITKKLSVGIKHTWIAIVFALALYLAVTLVPLLMALLK